MRVVPRENEVVNQTWISDRDRFSYQGLYSDDRLGRPLVRDNNGLRETDWQKALQAAAKLLKENAGDSLGTLVSPSATLEELYLAGRLTRGLGSNNIDHRLRQGDFRGDKADPLSPWLGQSIADLAGNKATLLVGSWLRKDQPMLNHRVRMSLENGGAVMAINPAVYDFNYDIDVDIVCAPSAMVAELAGVAAALGADTMGVEIKPDQAHQAIADALKAAEQGIVLLGTAAMMHPDLALLRGLASAIGQAANVAVGFTGLGANDCGAWMAGAVPHREAGAKPLANAGLNAEAMLREPRAAYLLLGLEPEMDSADPKLAVSALAGAKLVVLATHTTPWMLEHADVILPVAGFAETSGTLVNLEGRAQSFKGVANAYGESRPAWKVLRVLGNLVDVEGFDYTDSHEVRDELLGLTEGVTPDNSAAGDIDALSPRCAAGDWERVGGVPIHAVDPVTRRAHALQHTPDAWSSAARVNADAAAQIGITDWPAMLRITQDDGVLEIAVELDERVPAGCIWLPTAIQGSEQLGNGFGAVSVEKI
jgi:NADH-quinone oxidoreductase subunit G